MILDKSMISEENNFCSVLNSRQIGKTSLRVRTMWKLQAQGIACAAIDLRQIGSPDITPDQWYAGIMRRLSTSFKTDAEYPEYNPKQGDTAPAHFDISFDEAIKTICKYLIIKQA